MLGNSLQNKKIIISAGASGIGWAITKVCLAKGASVYLCDNDPKAINKVKKHSLHNKRIFVSEIDASDEMEVIDFFHLIKKKFKKFIKGPGQLKLHYSPGIPVKMNKRYAEKNQALIVFGKKFEDKKNYFNLSKSGNLNEAANNLYKILRKIKKRNFKSIAVIKIPNRGIGHAINDRLMKASNK